MLLVNRVPPLVAGIITGASVSHSGIGQFGAGAALGAAGMAAAATATGGAMLAAGAANAAGGAQALMAAFEKANEHVQSGSDVLTSLWDGGSAEGRREGGTGHMSYAEAAGFASSDGWAADTASWSAHAQRVIQAQFDPGRGKAGESGDRARSGSTPKADGSPQASSGGLMASVGQAGLIAADAAANLARGTAQVAKDAMASTTEAAMDRIADTPGGRVAAAIKAGNGPQGTGATVESAPTFEGNQLAGADTREIDVEAEVAAFVNRERRLR
jgi:type IV secretion system protein VirB6/type IV secretion system protein TrbL